MKLTIRQRRSGRLMMSSLAAITIGCVGLGVASSSSPAGAAPSLVGSYTYTLVPSSPSQSSASGTLTIAANGTVDLSVPMSSDCLGVWTASGKTIAFDLNSPGCSGSSWVFIGTAYKKGIKKGSYNLGLFGPGSWSALRQ